jgi:hypothetical protein
MYGLHLNGDIILICNLTIAMQYCFVFVSCMSLYCFAATDLPQSSPLVFNLV